MIHLQNLPHLHNDRDAIRFHRSTRHIEPLPALGDFYEMGDFYEISSRLVGSPTLAA